MREKRLRFQTNNELNKNIPINHQSSIIRSSITSVHGRFWLYLLLSRRIFLAVSGATSVTRANAKEEAEHMIFRCPKARGSQNIEHSSDNPCCSCLNEWDAVTWFGKCKRGSRRHICGCIPSVLGRNVWPLVVCLSQKMGITGQIDTIFRPTRRFKNKAKWENIRQRNFVRRGSAQLQKTKNHPVMMVMLSQAQLPQISVIKNQPQWGLLVYYKTCAQGVIETPHSCIRQRPILYHTSAKSRSTVPAKRRKSEGIWYASHSVQNGWTPLILENFRLSASCLLLYFSCTPATQDWRSSRILVRQRKGYSATRLKEATSWVMLCLAPDTRCPRGSSKNGINSRRESRSLPCPQMPAPASTDKLQLTESDGSHQRARHLGQAR